MKIPELRQAMSAVFHRLLMETVGHIQSQLGPVLEPDVDIEEAALFYAVLDLYSAHQNKVGHTRDLLVCLQQTQALYDHAIHTAHSGNNDLASLVQGTLDPILETAISSLQQVIDTKKLVWVAEEAVGQGVLRSLFPILVKKMGTDKTVEWLSREVAKLAFQHKDPS